MKATILTRLKRLEEARALPYRLPEFQVGFLKELPPDYTGDRHLAARG